jgi:hypothetical protein
MSAFPVKEDGYANPKWEKLFGVKQTAPVLSGIYTKSVPFAEIFASLPDMPVLSDFLVDRFYPFECDGSEPAAYIAESGDKKVVGSIKDAGKGKVCYMGFRLRDDQSKSTGGDISALFDVLYKLGVYKGEDSADYLARKGEYYFARFKNGAISASVHTRDIAEDWEGGFFRDKEKDGEAMKGRVLPPMRLKLKNKQVEGGKITYSGDGFVLWRLYAGKGSLEAFTGYNTQKIEINGVLYKFCDKNINISFAPLHNERFPEGCGGGLWLYSTGNNITVPNTTMPKTGALCYLNVSGDGKILEAAKNVKCTVKNGEIEFYIPDDCLGRQLIWLW